MDTHIRTGILMIDPNWRAIVCATAREWKGTRYVPKARVKGVGVDCGGLLYEVYNPIFGPFAAFPTDYPPDWALHNDEERYLDFVLPHVYEVPQVQVGGFSLFHLGLTYAHAAIMLDNGNYIHAWGRLREGSVIETPQRVMRAFARQNGGGFSVKHFDPKVS